MKVAEVKPDGNYRGNVLQALTAGCGIHLFLRWMKMRVKPVFVFRTMVGQNRMIFMRSAVSPGDDIWKACVNTARQEMAKHSEVKDIESKNIFC